MNISPTRKVHSKKNEKAKSKKQRKFLKIFATRRSSVSHAGCLPRVKYQSEVSRSGEIPVHFACSDNPTQKDLPVFLFSLRCWALSCRNRLSIFRFVVIGVCGEIEEEKNVRDRCRNRILKGKWKWMTRRCGKCYRRRTNERASRVWIERRAYAGSK